MSLWQIWWAALAVKTALLPLIPITPDEAYYLIWARHPALSYFDHPPFIAWVMTAALPLWKTPLGIRWPGVILSHLSYIPWIFVLRRLGFSPKSQSLWMLTLLLGPLTGIGGFVITPDVPMMFFWSLSILALLWLVEEPSSLGRWVLLGFLFGCGMLSKYSMVLFVPATIVWLIWEKKAAVLLKPGILLALVTALVTFSPVIVWNFEHGFASFLFQAHHGLSSSQFRWNWPFEYIGQQLGLLNPIAAVVGGYVIWKYRKENRLLTSFALVPFGFFLLTSFRARVEANWPICGYPAFIALAASVVDKPVARAWTVWLKRSVILSSIFFAIVLSHVVKPWLPIKKEKDHTEIMREWLTDVPVLGEIHPLFARSYQMAAFLSYYRPFEREVFKLAGSSRTDFYDFLTQSQPTKNSYVILNQDESLPSAIASHFYLQNPRVLPSKLVLYELISK